MPDRRPHSDQMHLPPDGGEPPTQPPPKPKDAAQSVLPPITPADLAHAMAHLHLAPGDECPACGRTVPKEKADAKIGPTRERMSIQVPVGEEGVLENMLIALVDKHKDLWPRDYAAMRDGVGLEVVGGRAWRYYAIHFAVYACLMVPELAPTEESTSSGPQ